MGKEQPEKTLITSGPKNGVRSLGFGAYGLAVVAERVEAGEAVVEVDVVNTSDRPGSDVVQVYVEPPPSLLHRPVRELKGFAKVHLGPGESTTARIVLTSRAFAYYDPGDQTPQGLDSMSPVPAGESHKRSYPGWYVDPGPYTIWTARSSANLVHPAEAQLGEVTI